MWWDSVPESRCALRCGSGAADPVSVSACAVGLASLFVWLVCLVRLSTLVLLCVCLISAGPLEHVESCLVSVRVPLVVKRGQVTTITLLRPRPRKAWRER